MKASTATVRRRRRCWRRRPCRMAGNGGTGGLLVVGHLPAGVRRRRRGRRGHRAVRDQGLSARARPELELGDAGLRALMRNELSGAGRGAAGARPRLRPVRARGRPARPGRHDARPPAGATARGDCASSCPARSRTDDDPYAVRHRRDLRGRPRVLLGTRLAARRRPHPRVTGGGLSRGRACRPARAAPTATRGWTSQERYAAVRRRRDRAARVHVPGWLPRPSHLPERLDRGAADARRRGAGGAEAPAVERRIERVRAHLLHDMTAERPASDELVARAHPPGARSGSRRSSKQGCSRDRHRDRRPAIPQAPELTVIVPLYKRIDFVEHQLAHFARDPRWPRPTSCTCSTRPRSRTTCWTRPMPSASCTASPLRIAVMARNAGFSGANNAGVSHGARPPDRAAELRRDPRPARLAGQDVRVLRRDAGHRRARPKLLYEDDSLAARRHVLPPRPRRRGCGRNHHYFKGMHRDLRRRQRRARGAGRDRAPA